MRRRFPRPFLCLLLVAAVGVGAACQPVAPTAANAVAAPAGTAHEVRFGMNVRWRSGHTYSQLLAEAEARYGRLDIVRVFHPGLPKGWDSAYGQIPQPQVTSFKAPPAEVLAGKHDAYLRTWFTTAPRDRTIYWSFHPEPEDDIKHGDYTASDFRAAFRRIAGLADQAGNPNLRSTLVLMWWTGKPKSGRNVDDYYPGGDVIDVIAWDKYNWGAYQGADGYYADAHETFDDLLAVARAKGKPVGFAEFGSVLVQGDDGRGRAAWLRDMARYLQAQKVEFVTYWNDATPELDYQLHDAASTQAWRDIMAG